MNGFEFRTHARTLAGEGASQRLGEAVAAQWGLCRTLVVTDEQLVRLGLVAAFAEGLRGAGHTVHVYDGVLADPPEAAVSQAIAQARGMDAQCVIGFGGGSSMDIAKLVAAFARSPADFRDSYGIDRVTGARLPLVQVPTTAGTGSEATPIAIVTREDTSKAGIVSPVLYCDIAVLDAELTRGLPAGVTAATGIDAIVHAVEAYTSRLRKNPISDGLAREALRLLCRSIGPACRNGADMAARHDMLLGAMLAGQAFANAPVAAVHALAYPLGGVFHVPHGLSNALMFGAVLRFNLPQACAAYAQLAQIVCPEVDGPQQARAEGFVREMAALGPRLGLPRRLAEVGVAERDLPMLAEQAMQQQRLLVNNPRQLGYDDALQLYREAL
ncbi:MULTISPECIES: iron-containing alcohol dehydrogenase [Bordetella]|uniref:Alcohol dehydrogenase n=1 Tax=Bordetella genomosp. 6 TaxID=463024 RepID=A0ABX4FIL9_9BORD|nr:MULTISPECIES: iron-containing alcohol dehydrogenase [Bordetella]AOB26880.1 alcohol dehydrogenase [Bordetella bronchiseptica]AZW44194.1 alcohol dehydrogenase [Bordetella bronchiseptica]OZI82078.1 alcohol dehydrogenase [Bordetella genomosp. 6]